jgi:alpha-ketoglutarate-dependent taurine dioxygenase
MLREIVRGPQAWRAETAGDPQDWYFELPQAFVAAAANALHHLPIDFDHLADLPPVEDLPLARERLALVPVHDTLERGRGFVILRGATPTLHTPTELRAVFCLIGQLLGRPLPQNVRGEVLYEVCDTGQDVRYGARFSVTNADSTFHTDNSFGREVADYVGLLCLNTAKSGGLSQMVSGYTAHNELLKGHPGALEVLYQPLHVDRRGGVRPGEPPMVSVPVFAYGESELLCRYLRYWIEVGHEKAGQPLAPQQIMALDTLDAVLADPSLRVEFALQPGDMYFINNRWLFHNRMAFEDHEQPERRRHLLRLWLGRRVDEE